MTCVHLRQLYQLCQDHDLKIGGSDLIRVVCQKCGEQEVCPSVLTEEYDSRQLRAGKDAVDGASSDSAD